MLISPRHGGVLFGHIASNKMMASFYYRFSMVSGLSSALRISKCVNQLSRTVKAQHLLTTRQGKVNNADNRKFSSEITLDTLLERNKRAVADIKQKDPNFFNELGKPQHPKFLYFGCSDARIAADTLLGLKPGEVFVHRNLGNCVPGGDLNSLSVLEYAVGALDVQHIIVGGHYDCGAVRAAMSRKEHGLCENWFRGIRDVYRLHVAELDAIEDLEERHRRFVELNVMEQCLNLYKTSVVQAKRLKTFQDETIPFSYPKIHGVTFDPASGLLKRLPLDFKKTIRDFQHVYDLYEEPEKKEKQHTKSKPIHDLNTSETG